MAKFELRKLGTFSKMSFTIIREDNEDEKSFCKKGERVVSALRKFLGKSAKIDLRCGGGIMTVVVEFPAVGLRRATAKIKELRDKYFPKN